ncbi:MAG TPA: acyltransferase family protein, partial [Rhizomicrobium sp.]
MAAPETKHFEILDGLRGVAAIAVLVGHASILFLQSTWVPRKLLAVQFFFMLSGFVITHAYEGKLRAGMTWREFMLRRIIRLYPLIVLAALVGFASYVVRNG